MLTELESYDSINFYRVTPRVVNMAELYETLRSAIIECRIKPGTMVVENQLVEKHHSTKAKVRTALRRLAQEGFLEPIPRMGHLVTLPTQKQVDEIFELRGLIETWTAREAASKITSDDVSSLRSLDFSVTARETRSFQRSLRANRLFHLRIAEIAGNALMTELLASLLDKVHRILHLGLISAIQTGHLIDDHITLIAALESQDCGEAERIAGRQVAEARAMIEPAVGAYWRDGRAGLALRR
jgi:DNA-binding GntR family transcriptional regulator